MMIYFLSFMYFSSGWALIRIWMVLHRFSFFFKHLLNSLKLISTNIHNSGTVLYGT